jgi:hypothetical protein
VPPLCSTGRGAHGGRAIGFRASEQCPESSTVPAGKFVCAVAASERPAWLSCFCEKMMLSLQVTSELNYRWQMLCSRKSLEGSRVSPAVLKFTSVYPPQVIKYLTRGPVASNWIQWMAEVGDPPNPRELGAWVPAAGGSSAQSNSGNFALEILLPPPQHTSTSL